jgi:hypothetical protein
MDDLLQELVYQGEREVTDASEMRDNNIKEVKLEELEDVLKQGEKESLEV